MKAEHYNEQLAAYTARAFAAVPEGEVITSVEADNGQGTSLFYVGTMEVIVRTLVLEPNEGHVTRRTYTMTATGLVVISEEHAL